MGPPSVLPGRPSRAGPAETSSPDEVEALFWSSLQLLGYEERRQKEKDAAGAGPAMFRRGNSGGLDSVLHFLLEALLGPEQLRRELRGCWPPADGRQRTEWKRFAKSHIDRLAANGSLPSKLANAAGSLLHTASGSRLVELLCHLSSHVLSVVHARMFPDDEPLSAVSPVVKQALADEGAVEALGEPLLRAGAARLRGSCASFLEICKEGAELQAGWQAAAEELTSEYRALLSQSAALQGDLGAMRNNIPELCQDELEKQTGLALQLWQDLQQNLDDIFHLNEASQFVLDGTAHPNAISGRDLNLSADGSQRGQGGSVDISALLESWTANVSDLQGPLTAASAELLAHEAEGGAARPLAGYHACHLAHVKLAEKAHSAAGLGLAELEALLAGEIKAAQERVESLQEDISELLLDRGSPSRAVASTSAASAPLAGSEESHMHTDRPAMAPAFKLAPKTPGFRGAAVDVATPLSSAWAQGRFQDVDLASVRRAARQAADEMTSEAFMGGDASPSLPEGFRGLPSIDIGGGTNLADEFAFQEHGAASPVTPPSAGVTWDERGSPHLISLTPLVG